MHTASHVLAGERGSVQVMKLILGCAAVAVMSLAMAGPAYSQSAPTVTIALGSNSIYAYTSTTVSGAVSLPEAHHVVWLQRLGSAGWQSIVSQALDTSSRYKFTVTPATVETVTLRVYDPPTASGVPAAVSPTEVLSVRADNPDDLSDTLPTGHWLVTTPNDVPELISAQGRMELFVLSNNLQLDNQIEINGAGFGYPVLDIPAAGSTGSVLAMQTDGNLVWRDHQGHVVFQSHTAGTGSRNYARVLDNGALVVRTSAGQTVWTSGTTNVLMKPGDELLSGQTLVNRTDPSAVSVLQMRTSGDLVLLRNSTQVWHSSTAVPGSHLTMTNGGQVVVVTPPGHLAWQSPSVGSLAVFEVAQGGRIVLSPFPTGSGCWQAGLVRSCGQG